MMSSVTLGIFRSCYKRAKLVRETNTEAGMFADWYEDYTVNKCVQVESRKRKTVGMFTVVGAMKVMLDDDTARRTDGHTIYEFCIDMHNELLDKYKFCKSLAHDLGWDPSIVTRLSEKFSVAPDVVVVQTDRYADKATFSLLMTAPGRKHYRNPQIPIVLMFEACKLPDGGGATRGELIYKEYLSFLYNTSRNVRNTHEETAGVAFRLLMERPELKTAMFGYTNVHTPDALRAEWHAACKQPSFKFPIIKPSTSVAARHIIHAHDGEEPLGAPPPRQTNVPIKLQQKCRQLIYDIPKFYGIALNYVSAPPEVIEKQGTTVAKAQEAADILAPFIHAKDMYIDKQVNFPFAEIRQAVTRARHLLNIPITSGYDNMQPPRVGSTWYIKVGYVKKPPMLAVKQFCFLYCSRRKWNLSPL